MLAGTHAIRALMLGYKATSRSVTLEAGGRLTVDIQLERTLIPIHGRFL